MAIEKEIAERMDDDGFFTDLDNTKPYLKVAFEGFAGCGKTYTMAQIAAGLHERIGSTKPIVIFDTEEAAKFLKPFFSERGIRVLHKRSRSLADLSETMRRCSSGVSDILMIDSITHVWENFLQAYQAKKNRPRLQFEDWGFIKPAWKKEFSEPFVRDPYHTLMTGRAGYEYEDEKDENGKRQIFKAGIKMKVEGETAYEPDILVLMSRYEALLGEQKAVWREATVIKDRSTLIDGKTFKNPTFEDFEPSIDRILADAVQRPAAPERDASLLVRDEENRAQFVKERDIALEEIEGLLVAHYPGQTKDEKKNKVDALEHAFKTRSWTAISSLKPAVLREGLVRLREFCERRKVAAADSSVEAVS